MRKPAPAEKIVYRTDTTLGVLLRERLDGALNEPYLSILDGVDLLIHQRDMYRVAAAESAKYAAEIASAKKAEEVDDPGYVERLQTDLKRSEELLGSVLAAWGREMVSNGPVTTSWGYLEAWVGYAAAFHALFPQESDY